MFKKKMKFISERMDRNTIIKMSATFFPVSIVLCFGLFVVSNIIAKIIIGYVFICWSLCMFGILYTASTFYKDKNKKLREMVSKEDIPEDKLLIFDFYCEKESNNMIEIVFWRNSYQIILQSNKYLCFEEELYSKIKSILKKYFVEDDKEKIIILFDKNKINMKKLQKYYPKINNFEYYCI